MAKHIHIFLSEYMHDTIPENRYREEVKTKVFDVFENIESLSIQLEERKTRAAVIEENELLLEETVKVEEIMGEVHDDLADFQEIKDYTEKVLGSESNITPES